MLHGGRKLLLTVVMVVTAGSLAGTAPAGAADGPPGRNGRLAFVAGGDIWTADPNGANPLQLTDTGTDSDPNWSPDGGSIAFVSTRAGNPDIFVMRADGSGLRQLTTSRRQDLQPVWSPNGRRLAFIRTHRVDIFGSGTADLASQLFVMFADGSRPRVLHQNAQGFDRDPAWSPDGQSVAYSTISSTQTSFYVVGISRLDGASQPVQQAPGENFDPDWTVDGSAVAYHSSSSPVDEFGDVWRSRQPSGPTTDLTAMAGREWAPSWATGGGRLAFLHYDRPGEPVDLWVRDAVGTLRRLVGVDGAQPLPGATGVFSWSPNSRLLAAATPAGLVVVTADGSSVQPLGLDGDDPDWQRLPAA